MFGGRVWTLNAQVNGTNLRAIIDSGATVSVISRKFVNDHALKREDAYPVQVANGETVFTLGSTLMTMRFDDTLFEQKVQVMETSAFDAVLGLDFLSGNKRCGGILTQPQPEKLLFDGKLFPLKQAKVDGNKVYRIFRAFKRESYTLTDDIKSDALQKLGVSRAEFSTDLFANLVNAQENIFCTRKNSAFFYSWSALCENGILWANPPFSQLERVLCKIVQDPCRIVLVTPNWKGPSWERILNKIAQSQFVVEPGTPLYKGDWDGTPLPSPNWETVVSYIDTTKYNVSLDECNPKTLKWLSKRSKGWNEKKLLEEMKKYPFLKDDNSSIEVVVQTNVSTPQKESTPTNVVQEVIQAPQEESPIKPLKLDFDDEISWMQVKDDPEDVSAQLFSEVDLEFFKFGDVEKKDNPELPDPECPSLPFGCPRIWRHPDKWTKSHNNIVWQKQVESSQSTKNRFRILPSYYIKELNKLRGIWSHKPQTLLHLRVQIFMEISKRNSKM